MRLCPIAKFLFKLIYNGNIFPATRKVIPPLSYCEIEAIKVSGIKFRKNDRARLSETVLLEIPWTTVNILIWCAPRNNYFQGCAP